MAIEKFIDELGTDLNKYTLTYVNNRNSVDVRLVRKATITQVGTLLNASKLNELVEAININSAKQITFNGGVNNAPTFFAPTSAGTNGYVLKSNGSGEPTWISQSDLTVGKDSEGNVIKDTYLKKSGGVMRGDLDMGSMDIINVANIEVGQDIMVESDSTNTKMNSLGFYAEDTESSTFVKLDSHKLNFNNKCNVDEHGINSAYGSWGFNDANEPTLLNKAGRFIQIATDSLDGNYNQYYFPEQEGEVALTSDIPKKVSQLENDAKYLKRSSNWEGGSVSDYILDSTGLYYVEVVNDAVLGDKRLVMGVIYYNGTEKYYITRYGSTNFALILKSNGEMQLRSYTTSGGYNTPLVGHTWFHWIKLG